MKQERKALRKGETDHMSGFRRLPGELPFPAPASSVRAMCNKPHLPLFFSFEQFILRSFCTRFSKETGLMVYRGSNQLIVGRKRKGSHEHYLAKTGDFLREWKYDMQQPYSSIFLLFIHCYKKRNWSWEGAYFTRARGVLSHCGKPCSLSGSIPGTYSGTEIWRLATKPSFNPR